MTKYARFILRSDNTVEIADLLDLATPPYDVRPLLGCMSDDEILHKIYASELVTQWQAAEQWFQAVPAAVLPGATFIGDRADGAQTADGSKYDNRNGFYADGTPVPTP